VGQVRDEHRQDYDPGRGGWGAPGGRNLRLKRRREVEERYADAQGGPWSCLLGGGEDWKEAERGQERTKNLKSENDHRTTTGITCDLVCSVYFLYFKILLTVLTLQGQRKSSG